MNTLHLAERTVLALLVGASICRGQPVITNQPAPQAGAPGTTLSFEVGASSTGTPAYQWQRDLGTGFSDLPTRTNAVLTLTNVQPWDAGSYRALVTDSAGTTTSAAANLYVMRPALVTTNVVIDNFDDNRPSGWTAVGGIGEVKLTETDQQFHVRGYWPGVQTKGRDLSDTESYGYLRRSWNVPDGQTVEWRVDLVSMNEHTTLVAMNIWSGNANAGYALFKGHDFIHLCKPSPSVTGMHGHFFHEKVVIKDTNVVMAVAVTRFGLNVVVTTRILDKDNHNAVLYERSVVDTPKVDRTLTEAELEAASGMRLHAGTDKGLPITSGTDVLLTVFQYNDGTRPAAEATFDNLERWTSTFPVWRPELAIQLLSTSPPRVSLTLTAAPDSTWAIEQAADITGPWVNPKTLVMGPDGTARYEDPNPSGFYRARLQ